MNQSIRALGLVALVLLVARPLDAHLFSSASPTRVLDDGTLDVEAIARVLCGLAPGRNGQISRLSTVDKLVEFFEISGESHEFYKCRQQHGAALRQLQVALNASKENVCSDKKLALIEEFHKKFVSTRGEHEKARQKARRDAAPELLRLFFMHYAMQVEATCKRGFIENLERDLKLKLGNDINERLFEMKEASGDPKERAAFRTVFESAMRKFTSLNPAEKCEDVLMVWDLIGNSYLGEKLTESAFTIKDELDPQTGEPIRMLLALRSSRSMNAIKEHCHYNLKPIYSKLVLPIIKLANLGYSFDGALSKSGLQQLQLSEQAKRWYSATQLCEALLPVKFYEDPLLGAKDVVIMTRLEAAKLDEAAVRQVGREPKVQLVFEPNTNSLVGFDRFASVAALDAKKLAKSVARNSKARRRVITNVVISLLRNLKNIFKLGRAGNIYFPKPTGARSKSGAIVDLFADEAVGQSLASMSDEDILKLEGSAPSRMFGSSGCEWDCPLERRDDRRLSSRWGDRKRRLKITLLVAAIILVVAIIFLTLPTITVALSVG